MIVDNDILERARVTLPLTSKAPPDNAVHPTSMFTTTPWNKMEFVAPDPKDKKNSPQGLLNERYSGLKFRTESCSSASSVSSRSSASSSYGLISPATASFRKHAKIVCQNLISSRCNPEHSDIVIKCSDGALLAHRLVLAVASPNFLKPLLLDSANSGEEMTTLILPDIALEDLDAVIRLIYEGQTSLSRRMNQESCFKVMKALGVSTESLLIETTIVRRRSELIQYLKRKRKLEQEKNQSNEAKRSRSESISSSSSNNNNNSSSSNNNDRAEKKSTAQSKRQSYSSSISSSTCLSSTEKFLIDLDCQSTTTTTEDPGFDDSWTLPSASPPLTSDSSVGCFSDLEDFVNGFDLDYLKEAADIDKLDAKLNELDLPGTPATTIDLADIVNQTIGYSSKSSNTSKQSSGTTNEEKLGQNNNERVESSGIDLDLIELGADCEQAGPGDETEDACGKRLAETENDEGAEDDLDRPKVVLYRCELCHQRFKLLDFIRHKECQN